MSDQNETIFGYSWKDIQAMQQKTYTPKTVDMAAGDGKKPPTEADYKLLEKYGADGLRKLEYHGVLDRLNIPFEE